jgi:hypothetical protein
MTMLSEIQTTATKAVAMMKKMQEKEATTTYNESSSIMRCAVRVAL